MRKLYVLGTGGFANEVAQLAVELNGIHRSWSSIEHLSESIDEIGKLMPFGRVGGTDNLLSELREPTDVAIGIGNPETRARLGRVIGANQMLAAPNLIHPYPGIDLSSVQMGTGNFIARGVALTCGIKVGDFNLFNYNCTVGHDVQIGSFNVLSPSCNVGGWCQIGDQCMLGTGAQVLPELSVANRSVIGAAALVTRSILHENLIHVGIPARAKAW